MTIREGRSEHLIHGVAREHGGRKVGLLVDGPKARSQAWDLLTSSIGRAFDHLLFLCFDSLQEHVPYYTPQGVIYDAKRSINVERAKVVFLYKSVFQGKGFALFIPDNAFCARYQWLNEPLYAYRNAHWGAFYPWAPYRVDRMEDHIAHSYKLGVIYRHSLFEPAARSGEQAEGAREDRRVARQAGA